MASISSTIVHLSVNWILFEPIFGRISRFATGWGDGPSFLLGGMTMLGGLKNKWGGPHPSANYDNGGTQKLTKNIFRFQTALGTTQNGWSVHKMAKNVK